MVSVHLKLSREVQNNMLARPAGRQLAHVKAALLARLAGSRAREFLHTHSLPLLQPPNFHACLPAPPAQAHDERNDCNVGDTVRVHISRPLSKRKSWVVTQILHRARVFDAGGGRVGALWPWEGAARACLTCVEPMTRWPAQSPAEAVTAAQSALAGTLH